MNLIVEKLDGVAVVTLSCENLDASNIREFKEQITPILAAETKVALDLEQVQFVDSPGLGGILSCLRQLNAKGGNLILCAPSKPMRTLLELVRMHRVFDITETREQALPILNA